MGMATWSFERLANIFGKSTQDIGEFDGKDYDKEYFDGDEVPLRLTADKIKVQVKK
jgi:2-oxoglutarate dehydrogenase E1 component